MTYHLTGDDKYRDLTHDDDYRSYLVGWNNSPGDYRFGRTLASGFASARAPL
jgi:hypothetical protein